MRLYIIGNGFDLNHGLPTSYWHYRDYLCQNNPRLVRDYECGAYFRAAEGRPDTQWNDLENGLVLFYEDAFEKIVPAYYPDMNSERTPGWDDINVEIENRFSFLRSFTGEYFYRWISDFEHNYSNVFPKYELSPEDVYVTFNYTRTLERVYGIPERRVFHVHGTIGRPESIQFGNPSNNPDDLHADLKGTYANDEFYNVVIEPAIASMAKFAGDTYKNISSNVSDLSRFLGTFIGIDEVIVMGHTLGGVDYPYYRDVFVPYYKNAFWSIFVYDQAAEDEANGFIDTYQIARFQFEKWH